MAIRRKEGDFEIIFLLTIHKVLNKSSKEVQYQGWCDYMRFKWYRIFCSLNNNSIEIHDIYDVIASRILEDYVTSSLFDNTRKSSNCAYIIMESRLQFNITFVPRNIKVTNIDQTKLLSTAVENFEFYDSMFTRFAMINARTLLFIEPWSFRILGHRIRFWSNPNL